MLRWRLARPATGGLIFDSTHSTQLCRNPSAKSRCSHFQTRQIQKGKTSCPPRSRWVRHAICSLRLIKCSSGISKSIYTTLPQPSMWHGHLDIQSSEAASSSTATGRSRATHPVTAATANEQGMIEGDTVLEELSLDLGLDTETELSLLRAVEHDCSVAVAANAAAAGQNHFNARSTCIPTDAPDDDHNRPDTTTILQRNAPDFWDSFTCPPTTPPAPILNNTSRCASVSPIEFDVDVAAASTGPSAEVDPRQPLITDLADACASLVDAKVREQELVLRRSMEASSDSESLIREWDRAQGLRFCHSKTTLATSRSRKNFVKTVFENGNGIPKKRGRPRKKKSSCTKESARRVIGGIGHAIASTFCSSGGSVSPPSDGTPPRRVSESSEAA